MGHSLLLRTTNQLKAAPNTAAAAVQGDAYKVVNLCNIGLHKALQIKRRIWLLLLA
jgi:hypothetical protein